MKRLMIVALFLGVLASQSSEASFPPAVPSLTPAQQAIHDAAAITDPAARVPRLREAIREGLFSSDAQTREDVFKYLCKNIRWLDLRPYADVLESFSRTDDLHFRALWLIDDSELMRASRAERMEIYRRAITNGQVVLAHGDVISRAIALSLASLDGLAELKELVARFQAEALPGQGKELLPAMELRAGASDREEAEHLAAGCLAAMSEEDFRARMDQDPGFRAAVLDVADHACAVNPFSGAQNPGCAGVQEVAKRQVALSKQQQAPGTASSLGVNEREKPPGESKWLERLKERTQ